MDAFSSTPSTPSTPSSFTYSFSTSSFSFHGFFSALLHPWLLLINHYFVSVSLIETWSQVLWFRCLHLFSTLWHTWMVTFFLKRFLWNGIGFFIQKQMKHLRYFMSWPLDWVLEYMSVLLWTLTPFTCGLLTLFTLYYSVCQPWLFSLCLGYFLWMVLDMQTPYQGGTVRGQWLRQLKLWHFWRTYFPIEFQPTNTEFSPHQNYIFAIHPHGVYCLAAFANFVVSPSMFESVFPFIDLRLGTLNFNFWCPLWREFVLMYKFISVDFQSCLKWLSFQPNVHSDLKTNRVNHNDNHSTPLVNQQSSSHGLVLCVGGAEESLLTQPKAIKLVLKKRKGFIKLALSSGAALVPVFSFGENDCFHPYNLQTYPRVHSFLIQFKAWFGWTFPLCHGKWWLFLPFRKRIVTVVGAPISVPHVPNPSSELIEEYHTKYINALTTLFHQYKDQYSHDSDTTLDFVS